MTKSNKVENGLLSKKAILFTIICINFLSFVDRGIIPGANNEFNSFIQDNVHSSSPNLYLGLLQSSFIVGLVFGSLIFGHLSHSYGTFFLLTCGVTVWLVAVWLSGFAYYASSYFMLIGARMLSGFGEASLQCGGLPWIQDNAPDKAQASWLALFYTAVPVGTAAGFAYGSIIANSLGWQFAYFLEGIMMVPLIFVVYLVSVYETKETGAPNERALGHGSGDLTEDGALLEAGHDDEVLTRTSDSFIHSAVKGGILHDTEDWSFVDINNSKRKNNNTGSDNDGDCKSISNDEGNSNSNGNGKNNSNCNSNGDDNPQKVEIFTVWEELCIVFDSPVYGCMCVIYAAYTGVLIAVSTFASNYFVGIGFFNTEESSSVTIGAIICVVGLIFTPLGGRLLDQLNKSSTMHGIVRKQQLRISEVYSDINNSSCSVQQDTNTAVPAGIYPDAYNNNDYSQSLSSNWTYSHSQSGQHRDLLGGSAVNSIAVTTTGAVISEYATTPTDATAGVVGRLDSADGVKERIRNKHRACSGGNRDSGSSGNSSTISDLTLHPSMVRSLDSPALDVNTSNGDEQIGINNSINSSKGISLRDSVVSWNKDNTKDALKADKSKSVRESNSLPRVSQISLNTTIVGSAHSESAGGFQAGSDPFTGKDKEDFMENNHSELVNISWVLLVTNTVGLAIMLPLYFVYNEIIYLILLAISFGVMFMSSVAVGKGVLLSVPLVHRPFAIACSITFMHGLGDVPSPIIAGLLKDTLAPGCIPDGDDDDNIAATDACRDDDKGLRLWNLFIWSWLAWSILFSVFALYFSTRKIKSVSSCLPCCTTGKAQGCDDNHRDKDHIGAMNGKQGRGSHANVNSLPTMPAVVGSSDSAGITRLIRETVPVLEGSRETSQGDEEKTVDSSGSRASTRSTEGYHPPDLKYDPIYDHRASRDDSIDVDRSLLFSTNNNSNCSSPRDVDGSVDVPGYSYPRTSSTGSWLPSMFGASSRHSVESESDTTAKLLGTFDTK